ncbi:SGNH/GDSL hydrolase family protein [Algibacter sp. R77976]|uniref:SGNH/GDSL hydrolase family protein n=1 Tax=Algibacter sp. R77976 TaxID=3093873 RepID=UPI0037C821F0
MIKNFYFTIFILLFCFGCSGEPINSQDQKNTKVFIPIETEEEESFEAQDTLKLLSLGDSYTIGQSVCETCRFPEQLKTRIKTNLKSISSIELMIIARTGWTTTNLINAIETENTSNDYDLVTLLIGVNNEFQNKPFSIYQAEFPQLVNTAIKKAKGNKNKIIVISIPDYGFTPFGNGRTSITEGINLYNNFAKNYCLQNNISYVYITDITRLGLSNPDFVASDGLHPSELAYTKFVDRITPVAIDKIKN